MVMSVHEHVAFCQGVLFWSTCNGAPQISLVKRNTAVPGERFRICGGHSRLTRVCDRGAGWRANTVEYIVEYIVE